MVKTGFIQELLQSRKGDGSVELGSILNKARTSGDLYLRAGWCHWMENYLEETWRVRVMVAKVV